MLISTKMYALVDHPLTDRPPLPNAEQVKRLEAFRSEVSRGVWEIHNVALPNDLVHWTMLIKSSRVDFYGTITDHGLYLGAILVDSGAGTQKLSNSVRLRMQLVKVS